MIAAAGSGTRLGAGGPKALVELAGRPLYSWALEAVSAAGSIGPVVLAAPPGQEAEFEGDGLTVVAGGASRSESVARALAAVETDVVAIHDAARPLAGPELFDAVISALDADPEAAGAIAARPLADTVKRATPGAPEAVAETVSREGLWAAETPQAFRTGALREALAVGAEELAGATDDAALVERRGGRVLLVESARPNLKVTSAEDARVAAALLAARR